MQAQFGPERYAVCVYRFLRCTGYMSLCFCVIPDLTITPTNTWGGQGLLGEYLHIRLCTFLSCISISGYILDMFSPSASTSSTYCIVTIAYVDVSTGVSIRFCSFEGASENIWHILVGNCALFFSSCGFIVITD